MVTAVERAVRIPEGEVVVDGDLVVPERAKGTVVFAHGSGSGRRSPRNRMVAAGLQQGGLATLLLDLLTTTHLLEEPGALDTVTRLARDWFTTHLTDPPGTRWAR